VVCETTLLMWANPKISFCLFRLPIVVRLSEELLRPIGTSVKRGLRFNSLGRNRETEKKATAHLSRPMRQP
jgi:hypothetical protein